MDFHSSVVMENTGFQGRVSGAVGGVSGFWGVMGREQYDASATDLAIIVLFNGGLGVRPSQGLFLLWPTT
jgi:hypothetical protein